MYISFIEVRSGTVTLELLRNLSGNDLSLIPQEDTEEITLTSNTFLGLRDLTELELFLLGIRNLITR